MKIPALLFSFILFFITFVSPVSAQTSNATIPNNQHNNIQTITIDILSSVSCQLTGVDPIKPKQGCIGIIDQAEGKLGFLPKSNGGGAIGAMGNMISVLYTPPLHTADYFQNLAHNFGIVKPAYAQGTGFEGLKPLIGLWTAFRNIVYLIFVIVFVVIGLAIMLRIKIDPRTVMSIQNQIPKIIVGLVLVTFSFAIAGFLIDLMYTSIYLGGNVIVSSNSKLNSSNVTDLVSAPNPFAAANRSVGLAGVLEKPSTAVGGVLKDNFFNNPYGRVLSGIIGGILASQSEAITKSVVNTIQDIATKPNAKGFLNKIFTTVTNLATKIPIPQISIPAGLINTVVTSGLTRTAAGFAGGWIFGDEILGFAATFIVFIILMIAMLFALFRLWFTLLMAYIMILIDVILAPFWIIGGLIPGSPVSFTGWLRDIVANLAAFPVVIMMFLLGKVFQEALGDGNINHFVPPLIGDRITSDAIKSFISLGIVLITPNIVNIIKTALKAPKLDLAGGVFKSIGVGVGVPIGAIKSAAGAYTASRYNPVTGEQFEGEQARKGRFGRIFTRFIR